MFNYLKRLCISIKDIIVTNYQEKRWWLLVLIVLSTMGIAASSLFVVYTIASIFWANLENIVVTVGGIFVFILILRGFWNDSFSRPKEPDTSEDAFRAMEEVLEDNYGTVSHLLSIAINEVADILKLKPVTSTKEMEAGKHWVRRNTFVLYLFTVLKTSQDAPLDVLKFKDLLNRKIKQKLDSGAFPGLVQTRYVSSGGVSFPILIVDDVTDTGDGFINLYVAWVGEDYAQYYMSKRTRRPELMDGSGNRRDTEF